MSLDEQDRFEEKITDWYVHLAINNNPEAAEDMIKTMKARFDGDILEKVPETPMEFFITDEIFGQYIRIGNFGPPGSKKVEQDGP